MRQRKIRNILSLLMIIALLLSACGGRKSQETSAAAPEETSAPETTAAPKIIGTMHAPSSVVEESAPDTVEPETGADEEKPPEDKILFWTENSPAMASIVAYVKAVTDKSSPDFVRRRDRIAVFDMDGTLCGERFPTYFDKCFMLHRILRDPSYTPDPEIRQYAEELEEALLNGTPAPESPGSDAQIAAEAFKGLTVEEYRTHVRDFMEVPAVGFENMTYGECLYSPMVALIDYLVKNEFTVFISSGSERNLVRELTADLLEKSIPPHRVIGSTFSLVARGQGGNEGRNYTYAPEDQVLLGGDLVIKNQKMNKVVSIVNEIGKPPILVFGNTSSDFAMAQYALQNGGKAYMLLCDDTERDYGDEKEARAFKKTCEGLGFETISMRDEFTTIYGEGVVKTSYLPADPGEGTVPAVKAVENVPENTSEEPEESPGEGPESLKPAA